MSDLALVSRYLRPYRRQFVLAALCAFTEATLELCIPFVMASIVDVGVSTGDMGLVLALGARMVALAVCAGALGMGYARFVVLETSETEHGLAYWRDDEGTHHVPKLALEDLLI